MSCLRRSKAHRQVQMRLLLTRTPRTRAERTKTRALRSETGSSFAVCHVVPSGCLSVCLSSSFFRATGRRDARILSSPRFRESTSSELMRHFQTRSKGAVRGALTTNGTCVLALCCRTQGAGVSFFEKRGVGAETRGGPHLPRSAGNGHPRYPPRLQGLGFRG